MKLGLSSYTFGWAVGVSGSEPLEPMEEHGLLDQTLKQGLDLLQIGDNLPLEKFSAPRLAAFRARASKERVQIEVGARRLTIARVTFIAGIARSLGARLLRFVIDDADYRPDSAEVIRTLRGSLAALEGLQLALENHDRFKAAELRRIVDEVGARNVGVCLDTANSFGAGEGVDCVVEALGPVTLNLHLKDFVVARVPHQMGFTILGAPAGGGQLEIPKLVERIKAFGRCETAILELWSPPENDLTATIEKEAQWAAASVAYLKKQRLFEPAHRK